MNTTRCAGRHCRPALLLPTGQSCSLQTCCIDDKLLDLTDDPGAHGHERGQANKNELDGGKANLYGGKMLMREVGMAGKGKQAHSPQNKPLQADTAGGFSARHRP